MAFHIELRVNLMKTLQLVVQVPIFYSSHHEYLNNILNLNRTFIF